MNRSYENYLEQRSKKLVPLQHQVIQICNNEQENMIRVNDGNVQLFQINEMLRRKQNYSVEVARSHKIN